MLVISIFSFSHYVFKRLLFQGRVGLCDKELMPLCKKPVENIADKEKMLDTRFFFFLFLQCFLSYYTQFSPFMQELTGHL